VAGGRPILAQTAHRPAVLVGWLDLPRRGRTRVAPGAGGDDVRAAAGRYAAERRVADHDVRMRPRHGGPEGV
jgi:uncharacterized membrane protein